MGKKKIKTNIKGTMTFKPVRISAKTITNPIKKAVEANIRIEDEAKARK